MITLSTAFKIKITFQSSGVCIIKASVNDFILVSGLHNLAHGSSDYYH